MDMLEYAAINGNEADLYVIIMSYNTAPQGRI